MSFRLAWSTYWILDQPGLHKEIVCQNKTKQEIASSVSLFPCMGWGQGAPPFQEKGREMNLQCGCLFPSKIGQLWLLTRGKPWLSCAVNFRWSSVWQAWTEASEDLPECLCPNQCSHAERRSEVRTLGERNASFFLLDLISRMIIANQQSLAAFTLAPLFFFFWVKVSYCLDCPRTHYSSRRHPQM